MDNLDNSLRLLQDMISVVLMPCLGNCRGVPSIWGLPEINTCVLVGLCNVGGKRDMIQIARQKNHIG